MTPVAARTLQTTLSAVGAAVLQALCLPQGPDRVAGEPMLFDRAEGVAACPDAILLLMGCRPEDPVALAAIDRAAEQDLAAVVVKSYGDPVDAATERARAAGVALLLAADAVPWQHLFRLLAATLVSDSRMGGEPVSAVVTGDLFALANAVATMVGGAVAIEDLYQHVLAYSTVPGQQIDDARQTGILGRRVPAEFRLIDLYDEVRRSEGVRRVELDGIRPRLAVAIRAGDEPVGSMWAIEGDDGFLPDAAKALEDAARLASLHILRLRTTADLERSARAEALRALLLGRAPGSGDALPTADSYESTVVAFELVDAGGAVDESQLARVADVVAVYCEGLHRQAASLTMGGTIYALLPTPRGGDRTMVRLMVERVIDRTGQSLGLRLRAGIGSTVTDLADVAQSRTDAEVTLRVLRRRAAEPVGPAIAAIADVRSKAILLQLRDIIAGDTRLALSVLEDMAAYDAEKGSSYVETLSAYLDTFGDVPAASARIFLHQNTFRHRMRRMVEIFHVDLDDPDERLVLWLLLRTAQT